MITMTNQIPLTKMFGTSSNEKILMIRPTAPRAFNM